MTHQDDHFAKNRIQIGPFYIKYDMYFSERDFPKEFITKKTPSKLDKK